MKEKFTREVQFSQYKDTDPNEWATYINSLSVPPHAIDIPLYHMSFDEAASGDWEPRKLLRNPNNSDAHPIFGELLPNRISTSPTIEGCWAGIFAYLFEELKANRNNHKEVKAYLYRATPKRGCRILTPDTLCNNFLVHDAHLTQEHCLLGPVHMTLERTLILKNTTTYPLKRWIKDHPFGNKDYGGLHYPPIEIISNEPYTSETTMSDLKINFSNEMLHSQLSLEAATNPLGMLSEGMTNKFNVLLTQLGRTNVNVANILDYSSKTKVTHRKLRHITDNNNYMQLMSYAAAVPPGFIGPLVPYMGLIAESLNLFKNIRRDITKPVAVEIGTILANPDRLRSSTITPLSRINFHLKEKEAFQTRVAKYYNPKSQQDEIAYSRLFSDNAEFLKSGTEATALEQLVLHTSVEIQEVLEDVDEISRLADKLAIRITQDKQTYGINASIANDIATAIQETAESISFLAALIVMAEEAIGVVDNLANKIK